LSLPGQEKFMTLQFSNKDVVLNIYEFNGKYILNLQKLLLSIFSIYSTFWKEMNKVYLGVFIILDGFLHLSFLEKAILFFCILGAI
jgi:hypothetical protein